MLTPIRENPLFQTNGKTVYYCGDAIRFADPATFEPLGGSYARDRKHCYHTSHRLAGAEPAAFIVLNDTYAKDHIRAWAFGVRIAGADAATFAVCDAGRTPASDTHHTEQGYAKKDAQRVYYYTGILTQAVVVKHADPATFVSLGNGKDAARVFYDKFTLPRASPDTWQLLDERFDYSRDGKRVYFCHEAITYADAENFEPLPIGQPDAAGRYRPYARDKNAGYIGSARIEDQEWFAERIGLTSGYDTILVAKR